jgi:hypothetical protein
VVANTTYSSDYLALHTAPIAYDASYVYVTSAAAAPAPRELFRHARANITAPAASVVVDGVGAYLFATRLLADGRLMLAGGGGIGAVNVSSELNWSEPLAAAAAADAPCAWTVGFASSSGCGAAGVAISADGSSATAVHAQDVRGGVETWSLPSPNLTQCARSAAFSLEVGGGAVTVLATDEARGVAYAACASYTVTCSWRGTPPGICSYPLAAGNGNGAAGGGPAYGFTPLWNDSTVAGAGEFSKFVTAITVDAVNGFVYVATTASATLPSLYQLAGAPSATNLTAVLLQAAVPPAFFATVTYG